MTTTLGENKIQGDFGQWAIAPKKNIPQGLFFYPEEASWYLLINMRKLVGIC
ncbi:MULTISPECIES: hypothetical protein [Planktothricoides]|uniref:Uncharacterized protein n=1 Tax=Planktothricoides raciborskii FACHB-1370 TaxID=2949576 RepID=A0ABR8EC04_9CYAN|nr:MULTISPECIES: hypothetical protein [Planktothricoides]MBD2543837.1 hypothetical protein [Planktothricoides raciborskii FACHB-1370]MBD2583119.1 hypothetical protein [Planktothricoides raciborskii FACHB-1261]